MKPIHIIGGGLAGLTLGIALRKQNVPVTISEAGEYPRHRVCGEFISGRGVDVLRELGLLEVLQRSGARAATTAAFIIGAKTLHIRTLPASALCISRLKLDAALADEFRKLGGCLNTRTRQLELRPREAVVFATGRRAQPVDPDGIRWFGLKTHARNVSLEADLEMHFDRDAYVGMCRLSDGTVNVCGLFRRAAGESGATMGALRGRRGSALNAKLKGAGFEKESFCAVAGLGLDPSPIEPEDCRVGDALTMIPPITGNGMSMAFESAAIAAGPLLLFAQGERSWTDTTQAIANGLERTFASRLRWARRFHHALFSNLGREHLLPIAMRSGLSWRAAFALTR